MNRFMKKFKTVYCKASFVFAVAVLIVTFSLCIFNPTSVAASQTTSGSDISTDDVTKDLEDVTSMDAGDKDLANATSDKTDGLNIYYNNESGSLSTPIRMFLVLTVLSLAPSHNAYIVYKDYNCPAFCQNSHWNADSTAQSGACRSGIVFDTFYYVADFFYYQ